MLRVDTPSNPPKSHKREEWEPQQTTRLPRFAVEIPDDDSPEDAEAEDPADERGGLERPP